MCAEKDPASCHRTILVCRYLRASNLEIPPILADVSLEDHCDTEQRLINMFEIPERSLFDAYEDLVEQAYDQQADRIAYVEIAKNTMRFEGKLP